MERKILFENKFVPTEEDIREYVAQQHLPERSGFITIGSLLVVAIIIAVWVALSSITTLLQSTVFHLVFGLCLIISVAFVSRVLKLVQLNALVNKYVKKNKEATEGFRTMFYEDEFESGGRVYGYSTITDVKYGQTCLYLITKNEKDVMVKDDVDAFKAGEHEKFWEFLDSKVEIKKEESAQSPFGLFRK